MGNGKWKISKLLIKVICEGQGREGGGGRGEKTKRILGKNKNNKKCKCVLIVYNLSRIS
jgi:hypothetical protein